MEEKESQDTKLKDENENVSNENTEEEKPMKENVQINHDKNEKRSKDNVNMFLLICIVGVTLGIALEIINVNNRHRKTNGKHKYCVHSKSDNVENKEGILKHVHLVLERVGYEMSPNDTQDWNLLWSHDYPFRTLYPTLHRLQPHQRVNHFPAIGYIANKVDLATTDSKYIPKAFKLPKGKEEFLKYASQNKNAMFLEKHNKHRGVYLKNVSEIDFGGESFVQEFLQNPFLVDGYKFDIGVYVVMTSVNPLRLYWYKGDVLFRYCPDKYYPLNASNLDQYVIGDDYLPTWKVPSLRYTYSTLGTSMKDTFDAYAQAQGKDTSTMWEEVQKAIVDVFLKKVHLIVKEVKNYPSSENFFEMMRVDLILDEDLKVYLLEANMSPNLSSAHFPPNQLLYEQVLYSLFSITGISNEVQESGPTTKDMVSSHKNIAVFPTECSSTCRGRCDLDTCKLCKPCLEGALRASLLSAHREFLHRGDFRRLFPPPMKQGSVPDKEELAKLSEYDRLQYLWYQGKCNLDITWCT